MTAREVLLPSNQLYDDLIAQDETFSTIAYQMLLQCQRLEEALRARAAQEPDGWVSTNKRLPSKGCLVLGICANEMFVCWHRGERGWTVRNDV